METTGIVPIPGENYGQKEGTYHFRSVSFFCVVHEMSSPNTNTEFISSSGYSTICNHRLASFPLVLFLFSSTTDWQFYPLKKKLLLCTKGWASFTRNSWTSTRTTKKTNSDFKLRARFLLDIYIFFSCTFNSFHSQFKEHCAPITELLQLLRENLMIFPCVLFGTYLFVNFHI